MGIRRVPKGQLFTDQVALGKCPHVDLAAWVRCVRQVGPSCDRDFFISKNTALQNVLTIVWPLGIAYVENRKAGSTTVRNALNGMYNVSFYDNCGPMQPPKPKRGKRPDANKRPGTLESRRCRPGFLDRSSASRLFFFSFVRSDIRGRFFSGLAEAEYHRFAELVRKNQTAGARLPLFDFVRIKAEATGRIEAEGKERAAWQNRTEHDTGRRRQYRYGSKKSKVRNTRPHTFGSSATTPGRCRCISSGTSTALCRASFACSARRAHTTPPTGTLRRCARWTRR